MKGVLSNPGALLSMWNFHLVLNSCCHEYFDMSASEYCLLLSIREHPQGIAVKDLRAGSAGLFNTEYYETLLLEKELITRIRSSVDRRALAYKTTSKGAGVVDRVDGLISLSLVSRFPFVTEDSFNELSELMHEYSANINPSAKPATIFPGEGLKGVSRFRRVAMYECSKMTMSFMQLSMLCLLQAAPKPVSAAWIAGKLGSDRIAVEFMMETMIERDLVLLDSETEEYTIAEQGQKRATLLLGRIGSSLGAHSEGCNPKALASFVDVMKCLTYFFG